METSADRAFRSANQNRAGYPSRVTEEDKASSTVDDADGRIGYSPEGRAYRGSDSDDEKEGRKQVRFGSEIIVRSSYFLSMYCCNLLSGRRSSRLPYMVVTFCAVL